MSIHLYVEDVDAVFCGFDRFESAAPNFSFGKSDSIAVPGVEAVCVRWEGAGTPEIRRKSSRIELASSGHESTEGR